MYKRQTERDKKLVSAICVYTSLPLKKLLLLLLHMCVAGYWGNITFSSYKKKKEFLQAPVFSGSYSFWLHLMSSTINF